MQYKFFSVPAVVFGANAAEDELNVFLRSHRILSTQREFVSCGQQSYWCCCVEYIENGKAEEERYRSSQREKTDYKKLLSEEEFANFMILRECRKELAEEAAVPAYAIFLDEQLAELAKMGDIQEQSLRKIRRIGEKKIEKYGNRFLSLLEKKRNEKSGQPLSEDHGVEKS